MKTSGIGGQAVMEGVMMKNQDEYAIAVRKPNQEIEIKKDTFISVTKKHKVLRLPIIRGMVTFVESMVLGMNSLTYSSSFYEEEETAKESKTEAFLNRVFKDKAESIIMGITIILAIAMAVGLFIFVPFFVSAFLGKYVESPMLLALLEGVFRLALFIGYVFAISMMKDIQRVFMYHGAEHKTINCIEHGLPLTVENVRKQTKEHKRCGTSFLVYVMFISIIFFTCIRVENMALKVFLRLILVPVIAGVSYEFIRFAGKSESKIMGILSRPGMWVHGLTTREPDDDMIEVAIASVEAVFDWKEFLQKEFSDESFFEEDNENKIEDSEPVISTVNIEEPVVVEELEESFEESLAEQAASEEKEDENGENRFVRYGFDNPEDVEEEDDDILKALDRYFESDK